MRRTLNILDKIDVNIEMVENKFNFKLEDLFLMAARRNPKRAFLFVSKLLGKHIPINPKKGILAGRLLGFIIGEKIGEIETEGYQIVADALKNDDLIDEALNFADNNLIYSRKATLFIGFAETATALGNSTFAQFAGNGVYYIHTTRDDLDHCISVFDFEEEHSHATSHFCYPLESEFLSEFERIVLIDDEITTGKTALNLIRAINKRYPIKEYVVASILDWRTENCIKKYDQIERELGIDIKVVSILKGQATCSSPSIEEIGANYNFDKSKEPSNIIEEFYEDGVLKSDKKENICNKNTMCVRNYLFTTDSYHKFTRSLYSGESKTYKYLKFSGRFGMSRENLENVEKVIYDIVDKMKPFEKEVLVLGTEEFMYIPMVMTSFIERAKYQSTTRSPIYVGDGDNYAVKHAFKFKNPFDKNITNYIYNIGQGMYKEILFVTERDMDIESKRELLEFFYNVGVTKLNFVYFVK
ncbi:phosphoribosyltransferase family protein [Clostridium sp. MB40-C1]|uniref:phosphoribosyltransferase family protein n=1 Tax=Clostridium sp. MB40-C1 TaxID=3070996 RepID=UPI0027DEE883|nr:phosphoribosyltransferase family protein [Clostridium sp. MB40-C1]WMJ79898.1 phosphoribosyltransferase family protein [Clostridium sp. MB40-C1]